MHLSFEGIKVDIPIEADNLSFDFCDGQLVLRCTGFTGSLVLSKPQPAAEKTPPSRTSNVAPDSSLLGWVDSSQSGSSSHKRPNPKAQDAPDKTKKAKTSLFKTQDKSQQKKLVSSSLFHQTPTASPDSSNGSFLSPDPKMETGKKRKKTKKTKTKTNALSPDEIVVPAVQGKWDVLDTTGADIPERWGLSATKISDNRVLVYGGSDDDERTLGDVHVLHLDTNEWISYPDSDGTKRTWHSSVFLQDKELFLTFGGERNDQDQLHVLSDVRALDPRSMHWFQPSIVGTAPTARSGHTCTVIDSDVIVFGGSRGRNRQSNVFLLDTEEWTWKSVQPEGKGPCPRTYHSAVTMADGKIVIFGGNDATESFNSVHVLERKGKGWAWSEPEVVGQKPIPRTGHSATRLNDHQMLVYGGWDPQSEGAPTLLTVFNDAFVLDTSTWVWTAVDIQNKENLMGRVGHAGVVQGQDRVLLIGGQDGHERRQQSVQVLSVEKDLS